MSNDLFDKDRQDYENIEIPEELDFMVRKSLKEAKRSKAKKLIYKPIVAVAAACAIFVISVNISPTIANAISNMPGLSRLVQLVTFDRGFDNAVSEGLAQEINWSDEKNGVKLSVTTIVGDWGNLWVGHKIQGSDEYDISLQVLDVNGKQCESISGIGFSPNQSNENYNTIQFLEYTDEFILRYKLYKNNNGELHTEINKEVTIGEIYEEKEPEYIAVFDVPINLDETIFNSPLINVELTNNTLDTNIGNIKFNKLETSKTRIGLNFTLESDKYDFMTFDNPRFIDNKGNIYETPSFYTSGDGDGTFNRIEFKGKIKDTVKTLEFKCDGIYYAPKDEKTITVDFKNKVVEPNIYGLQFKSFNNNSLVLSSEDIESISFSDILDDDGSEIISNRGMSSTSNDIEGTNKTEVIFKVNNTTLEKIELPIFWVMKDKIEGGAIKLIEK